MTAAVPPELHPYPQGGRLVNDTIEDLTQAVSRSQRAAAKQLRAMQDYESEHGDETMQGMAAASDD